MRREWERWRKGEGTGRGTEGGREKGRYRERDNLPAAKWTTKRRHYPRHVGVIFPTPEFLPRGFPIARTRLAAEAAATAAAVAATLDASAPRYYRRYADKRDVVEDDGRRRAVIIFRPVCKPEMEPGAEEIRGRASTRRFRVLVTTSLGVGLIVISMDYFPDNSVCNFKLFTYSHVYRIWS